MNMWWGKTNRLTVALIALAAGLAFWAYQLHELLLAPQNTVRITGPGEGYYWSAAQYQMAYLRLDQQLLKFADGIDRDLDNLATRHSVLQSKYFILRGPSELSRSFAFIPEYQASLDALHGIMSQIESDLATVPFTPAVARKLSARLESHLEEVNQLANTVRDVELHYRDTAFSDFYAKRRLLYLGGLLIAVMLMFAACLALLSARRYRRLERQTRASGEAQRAAREAAEAAAQAKNTFLGMVSHELRTPLHTIIATTDLLALRLRRDPNTRLVERLQSAAGQLEAQMRDLTDYARLESGKLSLRQLPFNAFELVHSVVDEHEHVAHETGLDLSVDLDGAACEVVSDPQRIRQVLHNLIGNAVKYTKSGSVRVSARVDTSPDWRLVMSVRDTGPGFAAHEIPLIFDPFTQLDASSTRRHDGAGLGLPIVQRLTGMLGGTISVDSRVGRGATFEVTIPVLPVPPEMVRLPAASSPAAAGGDVLVLVVDDHAQVRESFSEMIEQMGIACDTASGANEALDALMSTRYDVLFLDVQMPGKDGLQLLRELRAADGPNRHVPVVMISAFPPDGAIDRDEARCVCLTKPVHYEALRAAVAKMIDRDVGRGPDAPVDAGTAA